MSEGQYRGTIQLREAGCHSTIVRGIVYCLYCSFSMACMTFSAMALASAGAVQPDSVVVAETHAKVLNKKPDNMCDVPDASQKKSPNPNRGCLVPLSAIDKLRIQKDFSFVDVRSPAEYDLYHIAGSINIPLHQLKTKEFLKKLPVVLVNDGRSTAELEKTCEELKQAGFARLSVLEDGLFGWNASKRSLEGDPVTQLKLNRMTAAELLAERSKPDLFVIDISSSGKNRDISSWLPAKVIVVSMKSKNDPVVQINSVISQQRKKNPRSKPLLVADDNDTYARIDQRLQKSGVSAGLLRLDGGIKGYRELVTNQMAIWKQEKQPRRYEACRG